MHYSYTWEQVTSWIHHISYEALWVDFIEISKVPCSRISDNAVFPRSIKYVYTLAELLEILGNLTHSINYDPYILSSISTFDQLSPADADKYWGSR